MTKKEAIESIKNATKAITMLFSAKENEEDFVAVKVKDSDQLVDVQGELAVGTEVSVSSAMGSVSAGDDSYELENGQSFTTKGGKIDKVISKGDEPVEDPAKEDAPAVADEAKAPETSAPVTPDNTAAIATLVQKITELDTMINTIKTALQGKAEASAMSALGEQFSSIQSAFEILSDTPAEFSKVDKSIEAEKLKAEKLKALVAMRSKRK